MIILQRRMCIGSMQILCSLTQGTQVSCRFRYPQRVLEPVFPQIQRDDCSTYCLLGLTTDRSYWLKKKGGESMLMLFCLFQVYRVTVYQAGESDTDSFEEDPEISLAVSIHLFFFKESKNSLEVKIKKIYLVSYFLT